MHLGRGKGPILTEAIAKDSNVTLESRNLPQSFHCLDCQTGTWDNMGAPSAAFDLCNSQLASQIV